MPGSNTRALEKGRSIDADGLILVLEDAVSADSKLQARENIRQALAEGGYGYRELIVRINPLSSPWGYEDLVMVCQSDADAVLLPKVEHPEQIDALAEITGDLPIWAMMETPRGMLNAAEIAAHPRLAGMVMGTNDLAKELQTRFRPDRLPMSHTTAPSSA